MDTCMENSTVPLCTLRDSAWHNIRGGKRTFDCRTADTMKSRRKADYPIYSPTKRNAVEMLQEIGGLSRSEHHVGRLVQHGKLGCTSGQIEVYLAQFAQTPEWHRGGNRPTYEAIPPSGYMTISEAACELGRARTTIYDYIKRGDLDTVRVARRQFVSESSVTLLFDGLTSEPVTVTITSMPA